MSDWTAAGRSLWILTRGTDFQLGNGGVAFSPDGRLLACAGSDGTVRLWGSLTGKPQLVRTLTGHAGWVQGVAFSPDGRLLASSASQYGTMTLWDPATGRALYSLEGGGSRSRVAFSPDGWLLSSGDPDGTVRLWGAA